MSNLAAWKTDDSRSKPTTGMAKIARKRLADVSHVGAETFRVAGNAKLSDKYPSYDVTVGESGNRCSCQDHPGGQYRPMCSHKLAVLMWRKQNDYGTTQPKPSTLPPKRLDDEGDTTPLGLVPAATHASWGSPPLPVWVTAFRPHQERAIADIVAAYERGARYVFLDAPTGAGKTLIAEAVRRKLGGKTLYTCTTKTLQDQFVADFPYAKVLKGRSNYPTINSPLRTAADCAGRACLLCPTRQDCPYVIAKDAAIGARLAVVNTAYALAEWSMGGGSKMKGRDLAIVDECDLLEGAVMGWSEIRISERQQKKLRISPPEKKTVESAWLDWVEHTTPRVRAAIQNLPTQPEHPDEIAELQFLSSLEGKLERLKEGLLSEDKTDWVYTGYEQGGGDIVFKSVKVNELAPEALWAKASRWLLMSASIISPDEMVESLGIPDDEWEVVYVDATFPPENRPVYRAPVANMTAKNYDRDLPKLVSAIARIMDEHLHENILVHTVSYKLARDIDYHLGRRGLGHRTMTYTRGSEREDALDRFKSSRGMVMLAPSLDRGVDLPGDLCRVQVIAKIPYPYLGDKQVAKRMHTKGGQTWYRVQTIRTIVQMTGRAVRSADDHATTYILDKQFNRMWKSSQRLFPQWWRDGVDSSGKALRMLKEAA